jgi:hypothetical protein
MVPSGTPSTTKVSSRVIGTGLLWGLSGNDALKWLERTMVVPCPVRKKNRTASIKGWIIPD